MIKTKRTYGLGSATISLVIPAELLMELNNLATRSGFSRNSLIKYAIVNLLNTKNNEEKLNKDFVSTDQALNALPDQ